MLGRAADGGNRARPLHPRLVVGSRSYLALRVLRRRRHWLRVQYLRVAEAVVALEPTCGVLRAVRAVAARRALHPAVALRDAVFKRLWAAAERRLGRGRGVAAVVGAAALRVLVVLREALRRRVLLVARVRGVVALKVEVALVGVAAVVVVDVAALLVVGGAGAVALDPHVALLDAAGAVVALDPDVALNVLRVLGGSSVAPDVDVDVRVLGRRLLLLGLLLGRLDRLEAR